MNDLWIGREGDLLHLAGAGILPPLTGCRYSSAGGTGEVVEDMLVLTLESRSPADFSATINRLEHLLAEARTHQERRLGDPIWLAIQPLETDEIWRARILDGWFEMSAGGLADLVRGRM